MPVRTSAVAPVTVTPPLPEITPEKGAATPPAVSVALPSVTRPLPVRLAMIWLKLFKSSVPKSATSELAEKVLTAPARKVVALPIMVAPE